MPTSMTSPLSERPRCTAAAVAQRILAVKFRTRDGRRWSSIGGGATLAAAIAAALAGCPTHGAWEAVAWNDLYGE